MICPRCEDGIEFKHMHDCAHGIPDTHMAGSERYECPSCAYAIHAGEGKGMGLNFVLEKGN